MCEWRGGEERGGAGGEGRGRERGRRGNLSFPAGLVHVVALISPFGETCISSAFSRSSPSSILSLVHLHILLINALRWHFLWLVLLFAETYFSFPTPVLLVSVLWLLLPSLLPPPILFHTRRCPCAPCPPLTASEMQSDSFTTPVRLHRRAGSLCPSCPPEFTLRSPLPFLSVS